MAGDSALRTVKLTLAGQYKASSGDVIDGGDYVVSNDGDQVRLAGVALIKASQLALTPLAFEASRATVHGITIGVDFHWERSESQDFHGSLVFSPQSDRLMVVNELPLEAYLVSVISSEMSASAPRELLRAHAIVSRSWLLAQITNRYNAASVVVRDAATPGKTELQLIRWWDRENHADFDVCADDHCQRYQGIAKAFSQEAFEAVRDTRGKVVMWGDEVCDARYSKSCGGMTEEFRAAWEDRDVSYLQAVYDGESEETLRLDLTEEPSAEAWIRSKPAAFCNTESAELLTRILPGFDQETRDFFRWEVEYTNDELSKIILDRTGLDLGRLLSLEAIQRGKSSRIVRLRIIGEKQTAVIGKELQIRRALSRSHLYSSAFIIDAQRDSSSEYPKRFKLIGAGWGHGVGLCQIGAAVMAERGYSHEKVLSHYFQGTDERTLY
ncbi:MAG TPA: SpoIID/LytB domain-containing protein [Blastocatellia bacterium]|nr:SpoIID/LytB domain-containing protein [Blastocatellia bacterium]